jgi:hypothetical protein
MKNLSRHNLDFPAKICLHCTTVSSPSANIAQGTQLAEHGNMLQYTYATPQTPLSVIYLLWQQTKHSLHLMKFCHLLLLCCIVCPMLIYFFSLSTYLTKNKPDSHGYCSLTLWVLYGRSSSSSTFLTSQQFSWFSKEYRSHWPSISYSLFCHKLSAYTAWIKY